MKTFATTFMLACFTAAGAHAATLSGVASGAWSTPDASYGYAINNNDFGGRARVNWGNAVDTPFNNRWTFDGVGSDADPGFQVELDQLVSFGKFTYRNGAVNKHDFQGANLSVTLDFDQDIGGPLVFDFEFDVFNSINSTGDPTYDGDTAWIHGSVGDYAFDLKGRNYVLEIIGFSQDGGKTIVDYFENPEGGFLSARLFGRLTDVTPVGEPPVSPVPLPAGAPLMLLAGAALWITKKRGSR